MLAVLGDWSGSLKRSFSVAIDSTLGLRRCSGLKSKRANGIRAMPRAEAAKPPIKTPRRCFTSQSFTGSSSR